MACAAIDHIVYASGRRVISRSKSEILAFESSIGRHPEPGHQMPADFRGRRLSTGTKARLHQKAFQRLVFTFIY